jgi:hypothetical protein|tara:strand:- start:3647 stop:4585 length:939 start_codon:yes stop_codon:yes gene_type:complete
MIIDPTTRNSIFNPTSSQGTWFQHRWGKRDYPVLDLDLNIVKKLQQQHNSLAFQCVYGDPVDWIHFDECIDMFNEDSYAHVTTYGSKAILNASVRKIFMLDGVEEQCGKVFLGCDWTTVRDNILLSKNYLNGHAHGHRRCSIEFYLYEHNKHQIPYITDFCSSNKITLSFKTDHTESTGRMSIISADSKWLYDVTPHTFDPDYDYSNETPVELYRTIWSAEFLKVYHTGKTGHNILQHPKRTQLKNTGDNTGYTYVTPSGHAFVDSDEYGMFMNLLCPDWNIPMPSEEYEIYVSSFVKKFSETYLESMLIEL